MPGVILYSDSKQKLDAIKSTKPQLFNSRPLYLAIRHVLDIYTFKLNVRREIASMFSHDAKMKPTNTFSSMDSSATILEDSSES